MSNQSDDIERQLDDLRRAFAAKVGTRIEELTAAARPLNEDAAPEDVQFVLEALHGLAHKLAGSAGTFGYSQLSDAAKRLEALCLSILDGDRGPVAAQRAEIKALLAALEASGDDEAARTVAGGPGMVPRHEERAGMAEGARTVFVVDDDPDVASYLETRLTNFGFAVRIFPDPADLEQGIAETSPAAVIMDLVFPGDRNAGFHHIETLRARGILVCPVIVLTVRDDFEARLEAVRQGCDGYVVKPVDVVELAETLDRLIARDTVDPYRALLVDDDSETVGYHALLLKAAGVLTLTVTDPMAAVARLASFRPDVILMDINMPKCNGIELAKVIRQMSDDLIHIPIVFITSDNTDRQRLLTIRGGGDDFISKPVNPDLLVSSVLARAERTRALDVVFSRLKSSEERFHALARSANDAIISTDERGAVFFVNDRARQAFGYDGRDFLGKFAEFLIPEGNRHVLRDAFDRLGSDAGPQPFTAFVEIEGLRREGTTFPIEFSLAKWTVKNKDFFTILIRDISERRRAEEVLREREENLRAIVDNSPSSIVLKDSEGRFLRVNSQFERWTGYTSGEILGKTSADIYPRATAEAIAEADRAVFEARAPVEREVVIPRPDGTTDVMLMTKFPVLGPDNEVAGVGGISTKITERKLAEAALRDSEERLSGILDTAVDGIVTIDEGGGILSFNRAAETLFGYTADEVQGRNVSLLMPEPHRGRHDGFLARYLGGGEAKNVGFTREFEGRRKDGHVFPLQVSVSELRQGGKRLFTGILRDITKRKAEEEKLRVATDLAESANRAKSEFLTGMSHELRTPLNAILGFAQLLQYRTKEPLTPSQGDSVQQILKGGTHLLDLINEILNLAQIEAGKFGLSIEDVDPGEIVGECLALIRPQAEERGIKFVEDLDPRAMPVVRVDSTRFKQVLLNLLSNAVKYNRHDGTVTLACRESPGGMLRVSVADTGSGIPEDKQGAVFEPFNRLGAEATEVEGSGLGLTVSKKLVELMGGRIAFESTWGKGSTFWFEVPLAKEGVSGEPEDGTDGAVTGKAAAVLPPGDHTLLYVEDNLPNLRLMKALIGNLPNVTLLLAQDAETGVAMAKDRQPDVIVMDINLPGMDGFEALKRLRRSKKTRAIPVIALTASALARNREKGLEAGFRHYLTKPLDLERFLEALAETLARARDAD